MPPCQLPGHEAHVYTGYQLPYDPHEWDYNSWYDTGHEGEPDPAWYLDASRRQQQRHHYVHVPACGDCALRQVCDGFHAQYVTRWGADEARPYDKPLIDDPTHFVKQQRKIRYTGTGEHSGGVDTKSLAATRLAVGDDSRAGVKRQRPSRS